MTSGHRRNTGPMLGSPRCGAKTRSSRSCMSPATRGKKRCRMHGGAPGSGAPKGNQNAVKHAFYTRAEIEQRKRLQALLRQARALVKDIV